MSEIGATELIFRTWGVWGVCDFCWAAWGCWAGSWDAWDGWLAASTVMIEASLVTEPLVAVIPAEPALTGVTAPVVESTVAISGWFDDQATVAVIRALFWSTVAAVNVWPTPPTVKLTIVGKMVIFVRTGA